MADAYRDENSVPTLIGVLDSTGASIVRIKANSTTNALKVSNGVAGSNHGPTNAIKDGNSIPTLLAVSSADGVTPVPVYVDTNGNLLIKSI